MRLRLQKNNIGIAAWFLSVLLCLMTCQVLAYDSRDCIDCHGDEGAASVLRVDIKVFQDSIHGRVMGCVDCHPGIKDETHTREKGANAVNCGQCHTEENRHGQGSLDQNRPKCHSCHSKHRIIGKYSKASTVHPSRLKHTCKVCHHVECGDTDYLSWLPSKQVMSHKKQDFSRNYAKDNCVGCHQGQAAHGEEKPIDEQNCHECHMKMNNHGAMLGYIHARADFKKQPVVFVAAVLYQGLIAFMILGGFRHIILRLSGKIRKRRK